MSNDFLVIGAGLGRTGTASLQLALQTSLSGPCYHMVEVHKNNHSELWMQADNGSDDALLQIHKGYVSGCDCKPPSLPARANQRTQIRDVFS
jgi:hypothetical protein